LALTRDTLTRALGNEIEVFIFKRKKKHIYHKKKKYILKKKLELKSNMIKWAFLMDPNLS
jgi:hypothetical protein